MKWLKRVLLALGLLLLLAIAAVTVVIATFDPNAYKDRITAAVQTATGRELSLTGDIELSLFPWLGLRLGEAALGNAPGFGETPFAQVEGVAVHVALLPLLRKELRVDRVELRGLRVNLARQADGRSNLDDLVAPYGAAPAEPSPEAGTQAPAPGALPVLLQIGGVELVDARIAWDDAQTGTRLRVDPLNLRTGTLELGRPMPLRLDVRVLLEEPALELGAVLEGEVLADLQTQRYALRDLDLTARAAGQAVPGGRLEARLRGNYSADLTAQTAQAEGLRLDALGVQLQGAANVADLDATPRFDLRLKSAPFDPRRVLEALQVALPFKPDAAVLKTMSLALEANGTPQGARVDGLRVSVDDITLEGAALAEGLDAEPRIGLQLKTNRFDARPWLAALEGAPSPADPNALSGLELQTELVFTRDSAEVKALTLGLDDSRLTAQARVRGFDRPDIRFDLQLDAIDLDRYLPPEAQEAPVAPPVGAGPAAEAAEIVLPTELLRSLTLDGRLKAGSIKVKKMEATDVSAVVTGRNGLLEVKPLTLGFSQGRIETQASLDVRGAEPVYRIVPRVEGVQVGPLVVQLADDEYLNGATRLDGELTTRGTTVAALTKALSGRLAFAFTDGDLRKSKLAKKIEDAIGKIDPGGVGGTAVEFKSITGTAAIAGGVATNKDLRVLARRFQAKGEGSVDLVQERVKYTLAFAQPDKGGKPAELYLPLHVKGPFADLSYDLDTDAFLKAQAKKALAPQQEKVEQKVQEEGKKLEQDLKKGLEKLFR